MDQEINFIEIEKKWQQKWTESNAHTPNFNNLDNKFYCLTMFSYPSGDKLHVGHWYNYGPVDTYARFKKMNGANVFQPQGFDSFGLPAENYAIKHGIHPAESTKKNISKMREQLQRIGAMFDWSNELSTSDQSYYRWTQWLFLQLFKNGLAYQKTAPVNWCSSCATVLANEQVKEGHCDRCNTQVTKRDLKQWFFKITDYAEELLNNLDALDWPSKTKHMQKNWIGKSIGAEIAFSIKNNNSKISVFTTRPDTIYGATYMVLAPEHSLVEKLTTSDNLKNIHAYISETRKKSEIERSATDKEKTGVFTGAYAINPFNGKEMPIWISDYVLISYGSGAVMAVPSGDERDFDFANKFDLPITEVVSRDGKATNSDSCFSDYGICLNSENLNGLTSEAAKKVVCDELKSKKIGGSKTQFRLHDWLISRQRYWGTPIPIIHCDDCGAVPVPESQLPIQLPMDIEFSSTYGDDISPLATSDTFINTVCPNCNKPAKRDPDTMDTFVCSSWYYLRYPNAEIDSVPFDNSRLNWLPVDLYVGGAEHATMHLLYARFITKALRDFGYLDFDEPFKKLIHQGTITKDGTKMSKSKGNTVSPDEFIDEYGSDTFRAYLMFMGPFEEGGDWNDKGITGISRFLKKIVKICNKIDRKQSSDISIQKLLHKTIKSIGDDLNQLKFNTAISKLMELSNVLTKVDKIDEFTIKSLILLLAPITPHLSEELWSKYFPDSKSVFEQAWPKFDSSLIIDNEIHIAVQVNGKLRGNILIELNTPKDSVLGMAKSLENVSKYIEGGNLVKEIYVPNKIVNLVIK
ncbi:MAG: leucine--tRNA ligase [Candidatus Marinimicrobia bacterium]|nr:leucine--tRNA ligase [Candidatus Neomarinimicrobiota bacterium]